jgi:hypothetical protein
MGITLDKLAGAFIANADDQIIIPQGKADMIIHHIGQPAKHSGFFKVEKRRCQFM